MWPSSVGFGFQELPPRRSVEEEIAGFDASFLRARRSPARRAAFRPRTPPEFRQLRRRNASRAPVARQPQWRAEPHRESRVWQSRARSSARRILLVAWRSKASRASSRVHAAAIVDNADQALAAGLDLDLRRVAPASSEFSSSSLTTEAGRSTTSPAADLVSDGSGRMRMIDM